MSHPPRAHQQVSAGGNANGDGVGGRRRYDSASRKFDAADEVAVTDDWPEDIPVSAAEVDVLEMFLGNMLDAFLRPRH
jgi:hypothetical protein